MPGKSARLADDSTSLQALPGTCPKGACANHRHGRWLWFFVKFDILWTIFGREKSDSLASKRPFYWNYRWKWRKPFFTKNKKISGNKLKSFSNTYMKHAPLLSHVSLCWSGELYKDVFSQYLDSLYAPFIDESSLSEKEKGYLWAAKVHAGEIKYQLPLYHKELHSKQNIGMTFLQIAFMEKWQIDRTKLNLKFRIKPFAGSL